MVRLFLSGDYEFLCRLYGLSGASGNAFSSLKHLTGIMYLVMVVQVDTIVYGASSSVVT